VIGREVTGVAPQRRARGFFVVPAVDGHDLSFAKTPSHQGLICGADPEKIPARWSPSCSASFDCFPSSAALNRHVALENLALRHQLAVYKRTVTRRSAQGATPLLVALSRVWVAGGRLSSSCRPNTVLRGSPPLPRVLGQTLRPAIAAAHRQC